MEVFKKIFLSFLFLEILSIFSSQIIFSFKNVVEAQEEAIIEFGGGDSDSEEDIFDAIERDAIERIDLIVARQDSDSIDTSDIEDLPYDHEAYRRVLRGDKNLSGANLKEANLNGIDLSDVDFSEADLTRANLSGSNLSYSNLSGAILVGANLKETKLRHTEMCGVDFTNANFSNAKLKDIYATKGSIFDGAIFKDTVLRNVTFDTVVTKGVNFMKATLLNVYFDKSKIKDSCFSHLKLCWVNFSDCYLNNIDMRGCKTFEVEDFFCSNNDYLLCFDSTVLDNVNLSGSMLKRLLIKAREKNIICKAINFENVFFKSSMFFGECFVKCNFRHAKFDYLYMNEVVFADCIGLKQTFLVSNRFVANNIKFFKDDQVFNDEEVISYWLLEGGKVNGKIAKRYEVLWK